jgi:parvulin-like peptidyl-prolyl isomerase
MRNKIKKGNSFENIAKEMGLKAGQSDFITRDGYISALGPAKDFVEEATSLKNNEIGGPLKMMEGWVILKLDEYQGIDETKFNEEKETFKEGLLSRKKEANFDKWFEDLKKEANFVSYTGE